MNFSEQPPSKQWSALKYRGELLAEVWFKPEGEPFGIAFRVPWRSVSSPVQGQPLSAETLLKGLGLALAEVELCRDEAGEERDVRQPLSPPPDGAEHLNLVVRMKATQAAAEISESRWHELESRWKAILDLETSMDALRVSMESLRSEMESASGKALTMDEKVNALNADVANWTKAKSRLVHAIPKVKEFIHRSTWVTGTPERKQLEDLYKSHIRPRVPFANVDAVLAQLDNLLKDRQVLSAQGVSVHQECKRVSADVQGALRNLQANAAANATRKRGAAQKRSKGF